jgi:hypothetical protein
MLHELILALQKRISAPALPPLEETVVAEVEKVLGFPLPSLFRDLYIHVGNGRFGPGYGILSLTDGADAAHSVVNREPTKLSRRTSLEVA